MMWVLKVACLILSNSDDVISIGYACSKTSLKTIETLSSSNGPLYLYHEVLWRAHLCLQWFSIWELRKLKPKFCYSNDSERGRCWKQYCIGECYNTILFLLPFFLKRSGIFCCSLTADKVVIRIWRAIWRGVFLFLTQLKRFLWRNNQPQFKQRTRRGNMSKKDYFEKVFLGLW